MTKNDASYDLDFKKSHDTYPQISTSYQYVAKILEINGKTY